MEQKKDIITQQNNEQIKKTKSGKVCEPSKILIKYLRNTNVKDLFDGSYEKILFVRTTDLLKVALDKLFAHNIKSVLVFDDEVNAFVSSLELSDIQSFLIKQANVNSVLQRFNGMKLADILLHSEFEKFTCGQVSSLYNRSIVPIDLFISLENAINEIVSTGVPRLIAFDHNVLPIGVLSQSRIVATVSPLLINTSFALTPISELKVGLKYTTSFHDSDTLSTVFNHLQNRNLNSVPVLGRDMFVMGMVSTSDLRKVETLDSLAGGADCEVVLRDFLEPTIEKMKKLGVQYPVMATRQSPLSEVIANFQLYKIRQIFICEEKVADGERFKYKAVVGVVTLCDILQLVQKHFIDQQPLPSTHKHVKKESMSKSSSKKSSKHKDHSRRKEPNPVANSI